MGFAAYHGRSRLPRPPHELRRQVPGRPRQPDERPGSLQGRHLAALQAEPAGDRVRLPRAQLEPVHQYASDYSLQGNHAADDDTRSQRATSRLSRSLRLSTPSSTTSWAKFSTSAARTTALGGLAPSSTASRRARTMRPSTRRRRARPTRPRRLCRRRARAWSVRLLLFHVLLWLTSEPRTAADGSDGVDQDGEQLPAPRLLVPRPPLRHVPALLPQLLQALRRDHHRSRESP